MLDQHWNYKGLQNGNHRERWLETQPRGESAAAEIVPMRLWDILIRMGWREISGQT
jgi:hypothetical protein